jgi:putative membrane protein
MLFKKADRLAILILSVVFYFSSYFAISFQGNGDFAVISSVFILLMSAPSYYALFKWLGFVKTALTIILLSILITCIELLSVITGFPYGLFSYSDSLGYKIAGLVPITVSFAYLPILFGSFTVSSLLVGFERVKFVMVASIFNVACDLVIDPATVSLGFWQWSSGGLYYNIPLINFAGWFLTSILYSVIFHILLKKMIGGWYASATIPINIGGSLVCIMAFWLGVCSFRLLLIPLAIGCSIIFFLISILLKS